MLLQMTQHFFHEDEESFSRNRRITALSSKRMDWVDIFLQEQSQRKIPTDCYFAVTQSINKGQYTLRTFKGEDTKQLVSSLGDLSLCSCCYTRPSCLAGLDS